jgi:hypothetical protein
MRAQKNEEVSCFQPKKSVSFLPHLKRLEIAKLAAHPMQ